MEIFWFSFQIQTDSICLQNYFEFHITLFFFVFLYRCGLHKNIYSLLFLQEHVHFSVGGSAEIQLNVEDDEEETVWFFSKMETDGKTKSY